MRTLYIDCGMGAAGDMLTAALLELLPEREPILQKLRALGLPGVAVSAEPCVKCGITGTHVSVTICGREEDEHSHNSPQTHPHDHSHDHHGHRSLAEIQRHIDALPVPDTVRQDVQAVYQRIAAAESQVHGVPVSGIHFHEVGTLDALVDITAVCLLMHELHPDEVVVSPIHVGSGSVRCAHGILPVPAPATAWILRNVPIYGGSIQGELCTPTGAALLTHFADRFGELPVMRVQAIGYGMGKKDFPRANCVRVMLGETDESADTVVELSCNLDDMTGEAVGFAMEQLFAAGALDVFTTPIGMKKSRPGILLTVLCRETAQETMAAQIFRHTTTLGIRKTRCERYTLRRTIETVKTPYGAVRKKTATGYGVSRTKYEYADLARIAAEHGRSLAELRADLDAQTDRRMEDGI